MILTLVGGLALADVSFFPSERKKQEQPEAAVKSSKPKDELPVKTPAPVQKAEEAAAPATVSKTSEDAAPKESTAPEPAPRPLKVLSPADGSVSDTAKAVFSGVADPGSVVSVGPWVADIDAEGNWSLLLVLAPGKNHVPFSAKDAVGGETSASVSVTYAPTEKPEPKKSQDDAKKKSGEDQDKKSQDAGKKKSQDGDEKAHEDEKKSGEEYDKSKDDKPHDDQDKTKDEKSHDGEDDKKDHEHDKE